MFSIADFLDRAKARALIDSDYRLAKVIGKSHQVISGYRSGKSLPNESVIEQLCALSGDDPDLIAAQIQAARVEDGPARDLWTRIALRLAGGASTAVLSVCFAIALIAAHFGDARASGLTEQKTDNSTSYTSYKVRFCQFVPTLGRLRQIGRKIRAFFSLCAARAW
jgi:transcriptional regulator with XRE-family HTH domain